MWSGFCRAHANIDPPTHTSSLSFIRNLGHTKCTFKPGKCLNFQAEFLETVKKNQASVYSPVHTSLLPSQKAPEKKILFHKEKHQKLKVSIIPNSA